MQKKDGILKKTAGFINFIVTTALVGFVVFLTISCIVGSRSAIYRIVRDVSPLVEYTEGIYVHPELIDYWFSEVLLTAESAEKYFIDKNAIPTFTHYAFSKVDEDILNHAVSLGAWFNLTGSNTGEDVAGRYYYTTSNIELYFKGKPTVEVATQMTRTIYHELAHFFDDKFDIVKNNIELSELYSEFSDETKRGLVGKNDLVRRYGFTNIREFWAEAFAKYMLEQDLRAELKECIEQQVDLILKEGENR